MPRWMLFPALVLVTLPGCSERAKLLPGESVGTAPTLPAPNKTLIPTAVAPK